MTIGPTTSGRTFELWYLSFSNTLGFEYGGLRISGGCYGGNCNHALVDIYYCSFNNNVVYGGYSAKGAGITIQNSDSLSSNIDVVTLYGCAFSGNAKFGSETGADFYAKYSNVTVAGICPAGQSASVNGNLDTFWGADTVSYSNAMGTLVSQTVFCTPCIAGKYQNAAGLFSCIDCPAGKYSDEDGSLECTGCPAGRYNEFVGQDSLEDCILCGGGFFSSTENATTQYVCEGCQAGRYAMSSGSTFCDECPARQYSAYAYMYCSWCTPGTYQPNTGANACYNCPLGRYQR